MSDELFEAIVEQCRSFRLDALEPFLQGEPFCDPKILDRLERLHQRLPRTKLRLYSNGHALTPKRIDELVRFDLDHLTISLNALDPVRYHALVGLPAERTLANLAYLTEPVRRSRVARQITVRMVRTADTTLAEQDAFIRYCRERGVRCLVVGLFNYKGDVHSDLPVPGYPCEHIDRLDILADGRVTLCCMDQDAQYAWGNVREQSLLEVYRGKVASRYRSMHRGGQRRDIEPCGQCNLFWPSLGGMPLLRTARYACETAAYFLRHRPTGRRAPSPAPAGG
jgi:radical SAM protein with 4Fe4S-binding SPASM domain